jgi:hypothetical protein
MHRRIYQAIRSHDADEARRAMQTHLMQASAHQARESDAEPAPRGNGSAARNGSATRSRRVKSQPSSH